MSGEQQQAQNIPEREFVQQRIGPSEFDLRALALEHANDLSRKPAEVVSRAEAYLAFLRGDEQR